MSEFLLTTSWDDGSPSDLRLAKLLRKYQIPATFYISPKNRERAVLGKNDIFALSKDFEIGGHTLHHTDLSRLSIVEAENEIVQGKQSLEKIIGKPVVGFCYPKGRFNEEIKQLVGFCGFAYARTVQLFATSIEDRLLMPTTVHAYAHHPFVSLREGLDRSLFYGILHRGFPGDWEELAKRSLDWCIKHKRLFHLWGHSWEIEERGEWEKLERVFQYVAERAPLKSRSTNAGVMQALGENKKVFYATVSPVVYQKKYATDYQNIKILEDLMRRFDVSGINVLEIGCGTGDLAQFFKQANYTGVDMSEQFVRFARQRFGEKRKRFLVGDYFQRQSLRKQDLIVLFGLFESEINPLAALFWIRPYVKVGTRIIFTVHNASDLKSQVLARIRGELLGRLFPYTAFTPKFLDVQLQRFCLQEGFSFRMFGQLRSTLIITLDKC